MRIGVGLALLVTLWQGMPVVFECDIWPGEGRPRLRAFEPLALHAQPTAEASVSRLTVPTSEDLVFDQVVTRTRAAAPVKVLQPTSMSGLQFGAVVRVSRDEYYGSRVVRGHVNVTPQTRVEYLQYRAEGECFVRVDGVVWAVEDCPTRFDDAYAVEGEPVVELWARIVHQGRPRGWVLVDGKGVKVIGRIF